MLSQKATDQSKKKQMAINGMITGHQIFILKCMKWHIASVEEQFAEIDTEIDYNNIG